MYASSTTALRLTDFVTSSTSWPAASRSDAEPLKTGVTNVFVVFSMNIFVALIFTS